jgi:hypothetical protein
VNISFSGRAVKLPIPHREKKTQIINFSFPLMVARESAAPRPRASILQSADFHSDSMFSPPCILSKCGVALVFSRTAKAQLKIELFLAFVRHSVDEESIEN